MKGMLSINHVRKNVSAENAWKPGKLRVRSDWLITKTAFRSTNVAAWIRR
jgi:hypothetical protein